MATALTVSTTGVLAERLILTQDTTLTLGTGFDGQSFNLLIQQDSTGGHALTFTNADGVGDPSLTANATTSYSFVYDALGNVWNKNGFPSSASLETASQATFRLIDAELTLGYQGTTTVTGSVASVRGNTTIASGTTVGGTSFVYGTQGKLTVVGSLTSTSEVQTALLGQLDLSNCTSQTSPICAIWGDCGATMSSGVTVGSIDIAVLYNTTTKLINSCIRVAADASFFADITDLSFGGAHILTGTTASTAAGGLKIKANGNTRYIQLYSGIA